MEFILEVYNQVLTDGWLQVPLVLTQLKESINGKSLKPQVPISGHTFMPRINLHVVDSQALHFSQLVEGQLQQSLVVAEGEDVLVQREFLLDQVSHGHEPGVQEPWLRWGRRLPISFEFDIPRVLYGNLLFRDATV